jgi:hypothetical protein
MPALAFTFPGGAFHSIDMLPPLRQKPTLFNPVVYLVNGAAENAEFAAFRIANNHSRACCAGPPTRLRFPCWIATVGATIQQQK